MRWSTPAALLVLALLAGADATAPALAPGAWTQPSGGAGRPGVADLPLSPLDVLRTFDVAPPGLAIAATGPAGLLDSPHGILGTSFLDGSVCPIFATDPDSGHLATLANVSCPTHVSAGGAGVLLGYLPAQDAALMCLWGDPTSPLVVLVSLADGHVIWRIAPNAPPDMTGQDVVCLPGDIDQAAGLAVIVWEQSGSGVGVPFTGAPVGFVEGVDVRAGRSLWSTELKISTLPVTPPDGVPGGFFPYFATLTTDGVIVNGYAADSRPYARHTPIVFWLDRAGAPVSGQISAPAGRPADQYLPGNTLGSEGIDMSEWATASGDHGALVVNDQLVVMDAKSQNASATAVTDVRGDSTELAPPSWWENKLLVPTSRQVFAFAGADLTRLWNWTAPAGGFVYQVAIAPAGAAYVLSGVALRDHTVVTLHRLDLDTGQEEMRIVVPLPLAVNPGSFQVQMLPLVGRGEVLVWTDAGKGALLGSAPVEKRPMIDVDDAYPGVRDPFALTPSAPAANLTIAWGDGTFENVASGEPRTHRYAGVGARTVRTTATFPDGTTATSETVVHVGEPRPQDLTAVQRAFTPENQNLTFFLLGLALTAGGALLAALLARRRRSRLAREERRLRAVLDEALLKPTPGLVALEAERARLRELHTRRRLDDAHFQLLDQRAVRAMRSARYRLLGPVVNKASHHFRSLIDTSFEDGEITASESALLTAALDEEAALTPAEREHARALFATWAR